MESIEPNGRGDVAPRVISSDMPRQKGTPREIVAYLKWVYASRSLIRVMWCSELKQSIIRSKLSYLWWIMDPLCTTLCFVYLFWVLGRGRGSAIPYPVFILTALGPWQWGSGCWTGSARIWNQYQALVTQVRFPYLVVILARFLHELVLYLISYVVIIGACIAYGYYPRLTWVLLPVVIVTHSVTILTLMLFISLISLYFADFVRILPYLLRIWLFSSPVFYSLEILPTWARGIMAFNPMTLPLVNYRGCLLHGRVSSWQHFAAYLVVALLCLSLSMSIFIRKEPYITRHI